MCIIRLRPSGKNKLRNHPLVRHRDYIGSATATVAVGEVTIRKFDILFFTRL